MSTRISDFSFCRLPPHAHDTARRGIRHPKSEIRHPLEPASFTNSNPVTSSTEARGKGKIEGASPSDAARLASLRIKNLALVDDLTWELSPGFVAVTCATINVVGGFWITERMLNFFKHKKDAHAPKPEEKK